MTKQRFVTAFRIFSFAAFILILGNNTWWSLPRSIEVTGMLVVIVGLGYFYVWPVYRDIQQARQGKCPHCGKLLTAPVYSDTRNVG